MNKIEEVIEEVKRRMLEKFPDCSHTITVTMWDDDTFRVDCRHGSDKNTLHVIEYYKEEYSYKEIDLTNVNSAMIGYKGETYYSLHTLNLDKNSKPDPKYLGIPNIQFSLVDPDDDRDKEFAKSRIERGYDVSELWSLTGTIAKFILPRLKDYLSIIGEPDEDDNTKYFVEDCKMFVKALELLERDEGSWIFTNEEERTVELGLEAFPKIFQSLWY